ncbi:MAG: DNA cytosine methyltransferase [Acidobacteriota bacterium]|nr:DNA cytosine methyltransferase [Acidobacteriota bacterium]
MPRPIGIDLFAGVGGFSLGFEQAGFDIVAAVEIDPIHAAVHTFNFPACAVIPKTVIGLSASEIRYAAGIGNRSIEVVFGGAPCQGFSLIGKRIIDDPRNALVREFVRLVAELQASYFVFENVKGLTIGQHRAFLQELIEEFHRYGYSVRLPWSVLNTADFGVPQTRERLILLGGKSGQPLPRYPEPICVPAGTAEHMWRPIGPSCIDAIGDLPEPEEFDDLITSDEVITELWGVPSNYARLMRCSEPSQWFHGYRRIWNPKLLSSSMRTHHTEISRRRFAQTRPGDVEPISRFYKLSADYISNTLRAGTDSARGAFTSPRPIHYARPRCITVREMARLHGFPDWFRFHATKWHGAREIGNAVPPPFARAIAQQLLEALDMHAENPVNSLEMGCARLLTMDMSEAAQYFGVPNPIGRRDKKSGQRKRKQHEIEAARLTGVI